MIDFEKTKKSLLFHYPGTEVFAYPDPAEPTEIICEVEPTRHHPDYSVAVAVIERSEPHHHEATTETYQVINGLLELHLGNKAIRLTKGETRIIEPGTVHWAQALPKGEHARVLVRSEPGWTVADHIKEPSGE